MRTMQCTTQLKAAGYKFIQVGAVQRQDRWLTVFGFVVLRKRLLINYILPCVHSLADLIPPHQAPVPIPDLAFPFPGSA